MGAAYGAVTRKPTKARIEFENAQLRVSRLACAGGSPSSSPQDRPSVLVSLSLGEAGKVTWLDKGHSLTLAPAPDAMVETLRFLLKTEVPTR